MIRDIIFENSNISNLSVESSYPIQLKVNDSNTRFSSIIINPTGSNDNERFVVLSGNYGDSHIEISSSCTIQGNTDFQSSEPIILYSQDPSYIILLGSFTQTPGMIITSPWNIVAGSNNLVQGLKISVDSPSPIPVKLSGNLRLTDFKIKSSCDVTLDGDVHNFVVDPNVSSANLFLLPESTVSLAQVYSTLHASGESLSLYLFLQNTITGVDKIVFQQNLFTNNFINGDSTLVFSIADAGNYEMSAYLVTETEEIQIGHSFTINVRNI